MALDLLRSLIRRASAALLVSIAACSGATSTQAPAPTPSIVVSVPALADSAPPAVVSPTPSAAPPPAGDASYAPAVEPGNQTSLNAVRAPFAAYINGIHRRIHPVFTEVLASLDQLPPGKAPAPDLVVVVELGIEQKTGKLTRVGIVRPSGSTAFDRAALDALRRAQPFGPAPESIASPDGNVYLHWDLHRDPVDACSARNARPFLLKSRP